jgi:hypothetical protein
VLLVTTTVFPFPDHCREKGVRKWRKKRKMQRAEGREATKERGKDKAREKGKYRRI